MAITVSGTTITFNDATTQTTAATAGSLVTTANVLSATSGATVGAVGTYSTMRPTDNTVVATGGTRAGSGLYYAGQAGSASVLGTTATGTWRNMSAPSPLNTCCFVAPTTGVYLRIS